MFIFPFFYLITTNNLLFPQLVGLFNSFMRKIFGKEMTDFLHLFVGLHMTHQFDDFHLIG